MYYCHTITTYNTVTNVTSVTADFSLRYFKAKADNMNYKSLNLITVTLSHLILL